MTIRHLQVFIAVADCGKMSLAAKQLYISQPTVSQTIAELEAHYGVRLFERLSRRLYITQAGRLLLSYARHIVSLFEEMEAGLPQAAEHPRLKIGATITVGACVLTPVITRLEQEDPRFCAQVYIANTRRIEEKLLRSELDCALVEGETKSAELCREPVIHDTLILVSGAAHPFAGCPCVPPRALEGQPFLLREEGSGTRARFEAYLEQHDVQIDMKWECQSVQAIKSAVIEGQGLTVISHRLVERELADGRLFAVPLEGGPFHRDFSLLYHKNKFLSPPMHRFMQACRQAGSSEGEAAMVGSPLPADDGRI